jgi:hypothetical protein
MQKKDLGIIYEYKSKAVSFKNHNLAKKTLTNGLSHKIPLSR